MNDDDHGPPEPPVPPGPPRPCSRCGTMVEMGPDSFLRVGGRDRSGPICDECIALVFSGRTEEFYEGFPQ